MPPKRPRGSQDVARHGKKPRATPDATRDAEVSREALLAKLANVLGEPSSHITRIRYRDGKFSLIDIVKLFAGARSIENAAQTLQRLRRDYPEVFTNCEDYKFEGRRQRTTPVGDISMVVETILLVPGKQAASVRSECAKLFCRVYGGDLALTEQIIKLL